MPRFLPGLVLFFLVGAALPAQAPEQLRISADFNAVPLEVALRQLEQDHGLKFSYLATTVAGQTVSGRFREATWEEVARQLFTAHQLEATWLGDGYVSLRPRGATDLPEWSLCLLTNDERGEFLPFVTVEIVGQQRGLTTDAQGSYQGVIRASATDSLRLSYVGYGSRTFAVADLVGTDCRTITLTAATIELASVLISEYLVEGITATADGRRIDIRQDKAPPIAGYAEQEVYRSLSLLPGISVNNETAGDLSIRGGTRDQNLVLWDDIPIYSMGHYFGMVSNFSPELVKDVSVWRGRAEAEYGGRVSGVVRIGTDDGIENTLNVGAGASLLNGDAHLRIPLVRDRSDLFLGVRTTLPGLLAGPTYQSYRTQVFQGEEFGDILNEASTRLAAEEHFDFQEFNGRWQYNLGRGRRVRLSAFVQDDDFRYQLGTPEQAGFYQNFLSSRNAGIGLLYAWELAGGRTLDVHLSHTDFYNAGLNAFTEARINQSNQSTSGIAESSLRAKYSFPVGPAGTLKAGGQWQHYTYQMSLSSTNETTGRIRALNIRDGATTALAAFGSYHWVPRGPWRAELGLRLQYYLPTATLYPEPRISGAYALGKNWLLKAGYGQNHQFARELLDLNQDEISSNAALWTLADGERFAVAKSREFTLGFTGSPRDWLIDLELYQKRIAGISSLNFNLLQSTYSTGDSRSMGLDVLLKKRWSKTLRTWAVYSLSKTEWNFPRIEGGYFPADNDRRHQLRLVGSYQGPRWSATLAWQYASGARYTRYTVEQREPEDGIGSGPIVVRRELNQAQLPAYHGLDFSLAYAWKLGERGVGRWSLSLLNVYDQVNILDRETVVRRNGEATVFRDRLFTENIDRLGLGFTPNLKISIGWE
ncbi:TonB-dependent receptor [Neolewinella lacunae]|uniref:TonB-dependent receptor n=1 Tax=Neolewinella lacunae TaxID=1517758 RepID=A0A923TEY3_9BACT|nr:TonB-dependent receptor [Neolewinella lacunae]MBC6996417.1 TonB-dependent receptor [Neolewinella lacunae]MDN3633640.1 TonB-dependent receptor [Neolewinella lacunae]